MRTSRPWTLARPTTLTGDPTLRSSAVGVLGLAIAAMCVRAGAPSVVVLERGRVAAGPSGRAAGVLAPEPHAWEDPPALVELGRRSLRLTRQLDVEWDGALGVREIDCLLLDPPLDPAIPFEAPVEVLDENDLREREPEVQGAREALLIAGQAHVDPLRFAAEFTRHAGTVATGVEVGDRKVVNGKLVVLRTTIGDLHPGRVVFATGVAPHPEVSVPHRLVKGHLAATDPVAFRLNSQVMVPHGGALPLPDGRLVTGGTLDEGDDSPAVRPGVVRQMRRDLDHVIPAAASVPFSHVWCCFRPAAPDRLPIIDKVPEVENAWFTSGHYRTGLLMASATAEALTHWIVTGAQPKHAAPFGLSRFTQS